MGEEWRSSRARQAAIRARYRAEDDERHDRLVRDGRVGCDDAAHVERHAAPDRSPSWVLRAMADPVGGLDLLARLVQEYSDDENNPNVSNMLRHYATELRVYLDGEGAS